MVTANLWRACHGWHTVSFLVTRQASRPSGSYTRGPRSCAASRMSESQTWMDHILLLFWEAARPNKTSWVKVGIFSAPGFFQSGNGQGLTPRAPLRMENNILPLLGAQSKESSGTGKQWLYRMKWAYLQGSTILFTCIQTSLQKFSCMQDTEKITESRGVRDCKSW